MEIQHSANAGPKPAVSSAVATLSRARRAVLELLDSQGGPTTLATLVELSGLHENTLRAHLDGLAAEGLVTRERAAPQGRGRPAWLWAARERDSSEYAGLAATLAHTLRRTSKRPEADALAAGRDWGHQLASRSPARTPARGPGPRPKRRVVELLDTLGFAPERRSRRGGDVVRLTRCPLLEAAREEPTIVCNVHLGLVAGALEQYGEHDPDPALVPLAENGACLLHLSGGSR